MRGVRDRIPLMSVSSTSDDVTVTSSEVADLSANGHLLFYVDVNISSKYDVTDSIINAPVCFTATDDFGYVLVKPKARPHRHKGTVQTAM